MLEANLKNEEANMERQVIRNSLSTSEIGSPERELVGLAEYCDTKGANQKG